MWSRGNFEQIEMAYIYQQHIAEFLCGQTFKKLAVGLAE